MKRYLHTINFRHALLCVCALLLCGAATAEPQTVLPQHDTLWLQGAYYDSLNKLNLKEGIAFLGSYTPGKYEDDIPMKYADIELGEEGVKGTLGMGHFVSSEFPFVIRAGLSYAHFKTQDLAGVEAVLSPGFPAGMGVPIPVGMSLKLGFYHGLNHTPDRFMVGLGFGI